MISGRVVLFRCHSTLLSLPLFLLAADDFYFVKKLSSAGIFAIVRNPDKRLNIRRFLHTETWTLGVVVDLRCHENDSTVNIFTEVEEPAKVDESFNPRPFMQK